MKCEEITKTFEVIKKGGQLVFGQRKTRGFKNSLIEMGVKNVIGMCDTALEQIAKEKEEGESGEHDPIMLRPGSKALRRYNL